MQAKKFMTFREKVQPLTENEAGQLTGGFADVDMRLPATVRLKNRVKCTNKNCPDDTKNRNGCKNDYCDGGGCGGGKTDFENNSACGTQLGC